jgi:hypothetical protein
MRTATTCVLLLFMFSVISRGFCQLRISEVASGVPGNDWVELFLHDTEKVSMDIAPLYVTMYYGTNYPLATGPVTLYSWNRPHTPWDDRYAVIYLTAGNLPDETDRAGDINGNGIRELYCDNYSNSLWNSDCVVAVDTDDDPDNGGIIDFLAYSNRDGTLHTSIKSYVSGASRYGAWILDDNDYEQCMVDIGPKGLTSYQSIIRRGTGDTNTHHDFSITPFQTPGMPNMPAITGSSASGLFSIQNKKVSMKPRRAGLDSAPIRLLVYRPCSIRFRVFTATGRLLYRSPLHEDVMPGLRAFRWQPRPSSVNTGLYLATVEGSDGDNSQVEKLFIIADCGR